MPSALALVLSTFSAWLIYRLTRYLSFTRSLDLVPGPPVKSWIRGNLIEALDPNAWGFHVNLEQQYGPISRVKLFFGVNAISVFDPKALYHILIKDQDIFEEHPDFRIIMRLFFGPGILSALGERHRRQRKLLLPAFSVPHLRELVPVFYSVASRLRDGIRQQVIHGKNDIDMLNWSTRTALEIIGQSGLGYSFDPLTEDAPEHPFSAAIRNFGQVTSSFTFSRFILLPYVHNLGPARFRRFVVDILPWPRLHQLRDIIDTIHNTCVEIFETKKRAVEKGEDPIDGNPWDGKDIISILLKANMSASEADKLPDAELLAQLSTLIFAAMDTTSNTTARILHILASNPKIQSRLREEIVDARKEGGDLQYDELDRLPYLDAVCKEALRLYPVGPFLFRYVNKDVVLPLSNPLTLTNGQKVDQLHIPKGADVWVSIMGSNRNKEIWGEDADEWKPERWLNPLPKTVLDAPIPGIYAHLLTFLGGGRACLGFKFAVLEMKVILSLLLESFEFSLSDQEIIWEMNGAVQPAVKDVNAGKGAPTKVKLPLKVSLISP